MILEPKSRLISNQSNEKTGVAREKPTATAVMTSPPSSTSKTAKSEDLHDSLVPNGGRKLSNAESKKNTLNNHHIDLPSRTAYSTDQVAKKEEIHFVINQPLPEFLSKELDARLSQGLPFVFAVSSVEKNKAKFFSPAEIIEDEDKNVIPEDALVFCLHRHLKNPTPIMSIQQWREEPYSCCRFLLDSFKQEGDSIDDVIEIASCRLVLSAMFLLGVGVPKDESVASDITRDAEHLKDFHAINYALISSIRAKSLPLVDHFLGQGAFFGYMDDFGNEALLIACEPGNEVVLRRLIEEAKLPDYIDSLADAYNVIDDRGLPVARKILEEELAKHTAKTTP